MLKSARLPHSVVCILALAMPLMAAQRRTSFNDGWRFLKGDAPGAEQPGFDDGSWRTLALPHDWAIEGPFDVKYNPHTGALPTYGTGWYRKHFHVPAAKGRLYSIEFDGAMSNSTVWLNGKELGGRPYGYSSFGFDLTPHLKPGDNVIAVRLTPEERSSRWYPGAGIYRNVWLDETGPVRVARWGTYIRTPEAGIEDATVAVRTNVENRGTAAAKVKVETAIVDAARKTVARGNSDVEVAPGAVQMVSGDLEMKKPHLWDVDSPYLYAAVTTIREGRRVLDRYETPFGVRSIRLEKDKGFILNGRVLKIQGVCMHHDLGALGAAVNRRATERQLQIMKSMGVNAIRTSHNPPSPELLEYCDRLGLVVLDEAFDMWGRVKVKNGHGKYFKEWADTDLRDMIRRDRNHPSVVMWSIGNEILEQGYPEGAEVAKHLTAICHEEDPTRAVTAGYNQHWNAIKNGLADAVDIVGLNYKPTDYGKILKEHPNWMLLGAETASTVSSRGVYHLPLEKYDKHPSLQLTSYDILAPPWAYIPDVEFQAQEDNPSVLGEFVWTGFDYLGEPTPFYGGRDANQADWPARSSYFGIVDLAGFPKDRYYLYQSVWTKTPMVHVLPHWNWQGREGQAIPVMSYTNADEVELFLNGQSLGRKKRFSEPVVLPVGPNVSPEKKFTSKYRLMWNVPYAPGALKAVAYKDGKQVAVDEVRTAGAPARVVLKADRTAIAADGSDLSFVTVRIEDKDGNLCPSADNLVKFKVDGAGTIAAVDNGNAATVEPFQADYRKAFSGMALAIIRSERGKFGKIRLTATSEGLEPGEAAITSR